MPERNKVKVIPERKPEENLKLLAQALIAYVSKQAKHLEGLKEQHSLGATIGSPTEVN